MEIALTGPHIDSGDLASLSRAVGERAFSQGHFTRAFEKEFADHLGAAGAIATNSCTSALILALRTLGIGAGDEVLLPTYTCLAVVHAVIQSGAAPRLADVAFDPTRMDYNLAPESVRARITKRTKAIILPHMFGVPARVDEIAAFGVPVIEDITLALGARHRSKVVGSFGSIAVCSFHSSKMISAGEGGMLATNDPALLRRARYLNGWEDEQAELRLLESGFGSYELRYNFHMSDLAAALGSSQLRRLPEFVSRRRALARRYRERLEGIPSVTVPTTDPSSENTFFRFLVSVSGAIPSDLIRRFRDAGIEAGRGVFPPLHAYLGEPDEDYPRASRAVRSLVSVPLYPALTDRQVERILEASRKILSEAGSA